MLRLGWRPGRPHAARHAMPAGCLPINPSFSRAWSTHNHHPVLHSLLHHPLINLFPPGIQRHGFLEEATFIVALVCFLLRRSSRPLDLNRRYDTTALVHPHQSPLYYLIIIISA
jgi:hypothetical protein